MNVIYLQISTMSEGVVGFMDGGFDVPKQNYELRYPFEEYIRLLVHRLMMMSTILGQDSRCRTSTQKRSKPCQSHVEYPQKVGTISRHAMARALISIFVFCVDQQLG